MEVVRFRWTNSCHPSWNACQILHRPSVTLHSILWSRFIVTSVRRFAKIWKRAAMSHPPSEYKRLQYLLIITFLILFFIKRKKEEEELDNSIWLFLDFYFFLKFRCRIFFLNTGNDCWELVSFDAELQSDELESRMPSTATFQVLTAALGNW